MQTFKQGTIIDVDDNDSRIDQISREQASSDNISDLSDEDRMVFREDAGFKQRFKDEVQKLEDDAKGIYFIGTDMTVAQ
jgi:hypothetical protein